MRIRDLKILITGGAGFVGSSLAYLYRETLPSARIVCLDNLRRRGSELNVRILKQRGISFVHSAYVTYECFSGALRGWVPLASVQRSFEIHAKALKEFAELAG